MRLTTIFSFVIDILFSCLLQLRSTEYYRRVTSYNYSGNPWQYNRFMWHRRSAITQVPSNKLPTRRNNFPVYYPEVYLQLNMFRAFSLPSSGAQWLQWQPLVLPSYRGDNRAVFVVGFGRPDHEHRPPLHIILCSLTATIICKRHATCLWRWIWSCRLKSVKFSGCVPLLPVGGGSCWSVFWGRKLNCLDVWRSSTEQLTSH